MQHFNLLSSGEHTLLAAGSTVYCMLPTPIMEQLKQYVKLNRIEEALAIVKSAWGDTPNYEQVRRSPITPRMPAY